jgi:hypothetical protein
MTSQISNPYWLKQPDHVAVAEVELDRVAARRDRSMYCARSGVA